MGGTKLAELDNGAAHVAIPSHADAAELSGTRAPSGAAARSATVRAAVALAVAFAVVVGVSWIGPVAGVIAAGTSGIALAWYCRTNAQPLVLGLLPASALVASNLVDPRAQYLPVAMVLLALGLSTLVSLRRGSLRLSMPRRWIAIPVAAYALWAIVATMTSIIRPVSAVYAAGIIVTAATAFLVVPAVLGTRGQRDRMTGMIAAVGITCAVATFLLAVVGPVGSGPRLLGLYLPVEIVAFGQLTGIVVPRATGFYETPGFQGMALGLGLVALLAPWPRVSTPRVVLAVVVAVALVLTMSRAGWLLAMVGCGALAIHGVARGRVRVPAIVVAVVFTALLAGLSVSAIEVIGRYDVAYARYGAAATTLPGFDAALVGGGEGSGTSSGTGSGTGTGQPGAGEGNGPTSPPPVVIRGGSQLGARTILWTVSMQAIAERPITGYGPGAVADAIGPLLSGEATAYDGLTSHSTWLRTGVEMGVPQVAILAVIMLVLVLLLLVRLARSAMAPPLAPLAVLLGIAAAMLFESLLFGGLAYPSFVWTLAAGIAAAELVAPAGSEMVGAEPNAHTT